MKLLLIFSLFAVTLDFAWAANKTVEFAPVVQLTAGKVRGVVQEVNGHKVHMYQGIRYGHAKRFAKATPVPSWTDTYEAVKFREQCPQPLDPKMDKNTSFQTTENGEDCLYLSLWKPEKPSSTKRPVMVFIHGGSYTGGTIFIDIISLKYLAQAGDVIMIAIQYRLGPLAMMVGGDVPTNLGLHDQIFALKWIQENIHSFGGDSKQVTIFGESSGSLNVGHLILSPLAKGLFNRAIMQSGAPNSYYGGITKTDALEKTQEFAKLLNCSTLHINQTITCLRQKTMNEIVTAIGQFIVKKQFFSPIFGDEVLPMSPIEALKGGHFNHDLDSIIYGVNNNEGSHIVAAYEPETISNSTKMTPELTKNAIIRTMKIFGQSHGEEIAAFYMANLGANASQDDLKVAIANPIGDLVLTCPTILFGEGLAKHAKKTKFYSYRLMQHVGIPLSAYYPWQGVKHSEDISYLMMVSFITKPQDRQLSSDMIKAWTTFAKMGNPGTIGSVQWTEATGKTESEKYTRFMALNRSDLKMVSGFYKKTCNAFWEPRITQ